MKKQKHKSYSDIDLWDLCCANADKLTVEEGLDNRLSKAFLALLLFIHQTDWRGACHGTSAILYIIFRELECQPQLCTGVVYSEGGEQWVHSWIKNRGSIYDVACCFPSIGSPAIMPIFHDKKLDTLGFPNVAYGVTSKLLLHQ